MRYSSQRDKDDKGHTLSRLLLYNVVLCLLSLPYTFLDLIFFCFYIFFACKFCSMVFNAYICRKYLITT